MKIAVFHNLPKGGALRVVQEQVKYLTKNYKVKVFTHDMKLTGNRLKKDWDNFFALESDHKKLANKIDSNDFDVCLVHPDKLTQSPYLLRFLKTPTVYFCEELLRIAHEPELAYKGPLLNQTYENMTRVFRKRIDTKNAKSATKIITASMYIAKKVKQAYGKNASVTPLGVDVNLFRHKTGTRRGTLLFVGARDKINGYFFAKEIANITGLDLEVVDGFKLTDSKLARKYSESLATLCVSLNEPFGLVVLESMACGTTVLAVNEGGYKETVINKVTGYLLPREVDEFVKKINYLKKNSQSNIKMGKAGVRHASKNFSWQKHGKKLENLLLQYA